MEERDREREKGLLQGWDGEMRVRERICGQVREGNRRAWET